MNAMNDPILARAKSRYVDDSKMPVMLGFEGDRSVPRAVLRIVGTALILTAPAMWVVPGALFTDDVKMLKLGASVFFLLCGLALLLRNRIDACPEACFDPIRRELRVLQKAANGRPETVLRRSYDSLGCAKITKNQIELWDVDGSILMRMPIDSAEVRQALRMQLTGLVNIST